MATAQDIERWEDFGGSVEEKTYGKRSIKTWIAPDGKKFRSWKEASAFMEADETKENRGSKRGQDSSAATDETAKKRAKKDEGKQTALTTPTASAKGVPKKGKEKAAAAIPVLAGEEQHPAEDAADEADPMDEDQEDTPASDDAADSDEQYAPNTEVAEVASRAADKPGRQAAKGKQYREKNVAKGKKDLEVKTEKKANTEAEALEATAGDKSGRTRRLLNFSILDHQGDMQALDRVGLLDQPLKIQGVVYPEDGPLNKADGRLLKSPIGPVTSWHVSYNSSGPVVVACTAKADYLLTKPGQQYKKIQVPLQEQVNLSWHVLMAIDPDLGGQVTASLDAVVAKLARAKAGKGYSTAREALLLNGRFVLGQIAAHQKRKGGVVAATDKGKGKAPAGVTAGQFCGELEAELAKGPIQVGLVCGNSITIKDKQAAAAAAEEPEKDALTAADEDMARRLQAKMDAQQMGAGAAKARGSGAPYIKISESEIADEYPMPQQYKVPDGVEETDELLLWDEELADCDPEYLPKRLITDFTIYNAEGFFASLELLPLWSGVDPDVELFASGVVKDDEGDWGTGGQPLELKHKSKQQQQQHGKSDGQGEKKGKVEKGKQLAGLAGPAASGGGSSAAAAGESSTAGAAGGSSAAAAGGSSNGAGGSSAAAAAGGSAAAAAGGSSTAGGSAATTAAAAEEPTAAEAAAADDVGEDAGPDPVAEGGMRLFLSQIREWVVEYSADMLFISIRTDAAWYKLCRPNPKYKPWFGVPLKSARVAVKVIHALAEQSRASRMSFTDVVKMLSEAPTDSTTFISKRVDRVERYLVIHGQILLNQIKAFPNQAVQRSPFVSSLKEKMEQRKHSKLYYSKSGSSKGAKRVQRNPMKDRASSARAKPMPATATTMVRSIWLNYFYSMDERDDAVNKQKAEEAAQQGVAQEVEDDPDDEQDDDDKEENALAETASPAKKKAAGSKSSKTGAGSSKAAAETAPAAKPTALKVTWGSKIGKMDDDTGRQLYNSAQVGDWTVDLGAVVLLDAEQENQQQEEEEEDEQQQHVFGLVQCMWQDEDGDRMAQVRILVPGAETVLGDAGAEAELFVTDDFDDVLLSEVTGLANVKRLDRLFDPDSRISHFEADEALRKRNAAAKAAGQPLEYFYRHLYLPEQGMFKVLPSDFGKDLGQYREEPAAPVALAMTEKKEEGQKPQKGFIKDGVAYLPGDFVFLLPDIFDDDESSESGGDEQQSSESEQEEEEEEGSKEKKANDTPAYMTKKHRFHKGSIAGLRAWGIARLLEVQEAGNGKTKQDKKDAKPSKIKIQRFYRPEDISKDLAYKSGFWEIYASPEPPRSGSCGWVQWVDVDWVVRKCGAKAVGAKLPEGAEQLNMFEVKGTYNPATKKVTTAPKEFTSAENQQQDDDDTDVAMASMDIFAGCGGLSEGMHQAKVAVTKWAIEYERPAADAFQLNNPDAAVFCNNCNVILLAAMQKAGLEKDASACDDARTAAANLAPEDIARLPVPGEVEFIMGGPPCQGYSGMNRFNKGNWSMVQNSMVMSYLSYADFYRPRYFLLENVRNFVSHNKSFTFRLTLRTLLDMGYQVRFGVLNAGNFGVAQSRKRTFIWAAAPDELLPEWPTPKHVFRSPQLTVNLPGGVAYCAVDTSVPGAPLRTVTVRDAIGDLPPIENGHSSDVMDYSGPPVSAFQCAMRSQAKQLRDHICKDMNPLNLERCRCIPKNTPGADWRVLVDIVKKDPSREKFQGQPLVPWCLPNTAARHNGWRGLFGRLDLDGHFPTSTTDPQPMGKVGQVFHPTQDRIVSVRECARSQGFPDHFFFSGNVHSRHRQVGNAVPPPLAASLGRQLNNALIKSLREKQAGLTS